MVQLGYSMDKKEYLLGKKKIRDKSLEIDTGVMDILMEGIDWVKTNGH